MVINILNNDDTSEAQSLIKLFDVSGEKTIVGEAADATAPGAGGNIVFDDLPELDQYEVQVTLFGKASRNTLVTVFARDAEQELVAAQRVLQSELSEIKRDCEE
ncbi:hypothetical protein POL58_46455 [Nannocystis sp. ncelm1]|uniref:Uncharacterized protein n=1 Tax=Nannocystis radixulma TaxID=2995305 RepID=A0ABT5BNL6_9BACT|nr:hypothetical protein [Nannocystis radixulma]